ncbi:hypothetical protein N9Z98_02960 [Akkermansiaceae bacterium]|nr:hypothetical protein [Akkermansiaceae bacterium]
MKHSQQRGMDSSGLIYYEGSTYKISRADDKIENLLRKEKPFHSPVVLGHSRLITNGLSDNQPVVRGNLCAIHNGIITNVEEAWSKIGTQRRLEIDSELIVAIADEHLEDGGDLDELPQKIFSLCEGSIACAIVIPNRGKIMLFSNTGSLYTGELGSESYFASEYYSLNEIGCEKIEQIRDVYFIDIPVSENAFEVSDDSRRKENLIPLLSFNKAEESLLEYCTLDLRRCTRCILPETMPFIKFDSEGVCNYCANYKPRNKPKPKEELLDIVKSYRRDHGNDCIVPFSGGRDSCYGLHLIVDELKMKPVTYTYDWGMVTDLGRRNISLMCAKLGVENIIVAADISKKRRNIAMNLKAWLKAPHLGMISVLTAGDKHFFKYVEAIKKQTGINLNLWGVNPLEVTHFKAGFLGIKPAFEEKKVYTHGALNQLRYQRKRFAAMLRSPGYFNSSIWDTLSGEYYRSFTEKEDYFHIFDYWRWDEEDVNLILDNYGWERAVDTNTTWRIGDGTAGFYNYVYYTVAGFTEHDTFRSNQIREGQLCRNDALKLVTDDNRPRYENIRWYLDTLGMNFKAVIDVVHSIPKLYKID